MKRKIAVVLKPPADTDRRQELKRAVAALREQGHRVRIRVTRGPGDARRLARSAARCGWDVVVAAGGDGTINEVVNGLARAGTRTPLAIVPLGTANDFAGAIGIPEESGVALRLAAEGEAVPIDVARVNRRCFINVSTAGFGVEASQSAKHGLKRHLGGLAYVLLGAKDLVSFDTYQGIFRIDDEVVHDGEFVFFAVGNSRQTGGGTQVAPLAQADDGRLDVVIVLGVTRQQFIALLPQVRAGTHLDSEHVRYFRARTFAVETADDVAVNADGQPVAGRSFHYDLMSQRQLLIIPTRAES